MRIQTFKRTAYWLVLGFLAFLSMTELNAKKGNESTVCPTPPFTPAPLPKGKWLNGTFSMSNWWTYDGKQYVGNPYSRSVAFNFAEKGKSEFFLIIKTHSGYCTTEAFTYLKGTVEFTEGEQSFTFYPASGNYRGFYSCAAGSNFNRPARPAELKPTKYYWSMEKDSQGQEYMVIRFSADKSTAGSYFKPTDW